MSRAASGGTDRPARNRYKEAPIEQVVESLIAKLAARARRLKREAEARGEPWPPPPRDPSWYEQYMSDEDDDESDESDGAATPPADPDAAAIALLGRWHTPERDT